MSESGRLSNKMAQQPSQKSGSQDVQRLLDLRSQMKDRQPKFARFESWRYVRIHEPWRKPKGVDNHSRLSVKGWPPLVRIGYRGPRLVRGMHPSGYREVLIHNLKELEAVSPSEEAARLAAGVGKRKRIEIAKRAKELHVRVLNGRGLLSPTSAEEKEEKDEKKSKKRK
jgi:large subunit ribosomal protein L32e